MNLSGNNGNAWRVPHSFPYHTLVEDFRQVMRLNQADGKKRNVDMCLLKVALRVLSQKKT